MPSNSVQNHTEIGVISPFVAQTVQNTTYGRYTRENPIRPIITLQSSVHLESVEGQSNIFTIIQ